jgi:streptomycin 6-kinase
MEDVLFANSFSFLTMDLPREFLKNIHAEFGERGREWLSRLPKLVEEASDRWGLKDVQAVTNLSYNFVAFASCPSPPPPVPRGEGSVVLKIGVPNQELTSEMNALKIFDGEGACRLLDFDEEKGFLLIERLEPGRMLADLDDDDERTHIALDTMQNLWKPVPAGGTKGLIRLEAWFDGLKEIRPMFNGGTGPIPGKLLERVEAALPDLFADGEVRLMHGDFHHYNILSSERGWLAIDPKGVIGPAGYEIGPLMLNPWIKPMDRISFKSQAERRVSIIKERTGWAREKIIGWSLAHSVLSAYWDLELDPAYPAEAAEIFSTLK